MKEREREWEGGREEDTDVMKPPPDVNPLGAEATLTLKATTHRDHTIICDDIILERLEALQ